jgi:hypothetical protein
MTPERLATFLFADIAGFTALTEAHGDDHAAAILLGILVYPWGVWYRGIAHTPSVSGDHDEPAR